MIQNESQNYYIVIGVVNRTEYWQTSRHFDSDKRRLIYKRD